MPHPSSITRTSDIPPRRIAISILRAPASMPFSISSFTTEAGCSTTSPAATWLATVSGSNRIRLIGSEVSGQKSEVRLALYRFIASTLNDSPLVDLKGLDRNFLHDQYHRERCPRASFLAPKQTSRCGQRSPRPDCQGRLFRSAVRDGAR